MWTLLAKIKCDQNPSLGRSENKWKNRRDSGFYSALTASDSDLYTVTFIPFFVALMSWHTHVLFFLWGTWGTCEKAVISARERQVLHEKQQWNFSCSTSTIASIIFFSLFFWCCLENRSCSSAIMAIQTNLAINISAGSKWSVDFHWECLLNQCLPTIPKHWWVKALQRKGCSP